jgi:hypothetical protein
MANATLVLSVHWEGRGLDGVPYLARARRELLPNVPVTHYVSAAYFARGGDLDAIIERMLPAFSSGDEVALHVHGWHSIRGALDPVSETVITGADPKLQIAYPGISEQLDAGFTHPVCAHSSPVIDSYIQNSRLLLRPFLTALVKKKGINVERMLRGIRAGHGLATDRFLDCARRAGFLYDASAMDSVWAERAAADSLRQELPEAGANAFAPLLGMWSALWGAQRKPMPSEAWTNQGLWSGTSGAGINSTTQPFHIRGDENNSLFEMPLNGGLVPPFAPEEVLQTIAAALIAPISDRRIVSFAIRQETAEESLNHIAASDIVRAPDIRWATNIDLLSAVERSEPPASGMSPWEAARQHFSRQYQPWAAPSEPPEVRVPQIHVPSINLNLGG